MNFFPLLRPLYFLFLFFLAAALIPPVFYSKPKCYPPVSLKWSPKECDDIFDRLSIEQLLSMKKAALEIETWERILEGEKTNVVLEVLPEKEEFYEFIHCPKGEGLDREKGAHYYYHAHRGKEHGHFHLFLSDRLFSLPPLVHETSLKKTSPYVHLIAISMDQYSKPKKLFTVNQWVVGDKWYGAEEIVAHLCDFEMDVESPFWATQKWLSAMVKLFAPQIEALLKARDLQIGKNYHRLEERQLETLSEMKISVKTQHKLIERALERRMFSPFVDLEELN